MKKEIIKIDVSEWDLETVRIMNEVLCDVDTHEKRVEFAKNVSSMSPSMAAMYARELMMRKQMSVLAQ